MYVRSFLQDNQFLQNLSVKISYNPLKFPSFPKKHFRIPFYWKGLTEDSNCVFTIWPSGHQRTNCLYDKLLWNLLNDFLLFIVSKHSTSILGKVSV